MIRAPHSRTVSPDATLRRSTPTPSGVNPHGGNPMTILRSTRARLGLLTVGLAAAAVPILSQPASAAPQNCRFIFRTLQAVDVQEELFLGNGDEIFVKIEGVNFPSTGTVKYRADGVIRSANSFGSPQVNYSDSNPLTIRVVEDDTVINDRIGRDKNLECTGDQTDQVLRFADASAEYLLTYNVDLL
jgi:hypothetical protein